MGDDQEYDVGAPPLAALIGWRNRLVSAWCASAQNARRTGWITLIGAAAGLATIFAALYDPIGSGCRVIGWCNQPPNAVATNMEATISEIAWGPSLTLGESYVDHDLDVPAHLVPFLDWTGQRVTARIAFRGLAGETFFVRWTLYDQATGNRIPNDTSPWKSVDAPALPFDTLTVEASESDAANVAIWIPNIVSGSFTVEIAVRDERHVVLDRTRTPQYTVTDQDVPPAATPARTQAWRAPVSENAVSTEDQLLVEDEAPTPTPFTVPIDQGTSTDTPLNKPPTEEPTSEVEITATSTEAVAAQTTSESEDNTPPPMVTRKANEGPTPIPTTAVIVTQVIPDQDSETEDNLDVLLGSGVLAMLTLGVGVILLKRRSTG